MLEILQTYLVEYLSNPETDLEAEGFKSFMVRICDKLLLESTDPALSAKIAKLKAYVEIYF